MGLQKDKRFSIGTSDFKTLRREDLYYVDKTLDLLHLVQNHSTALITRPAKFGKSLTISTLDYLFSGHRDLFKGLAIEPLWDWGTTYPVLLFDFNFGGTVFDLGCVLAAQIRRNALRLGVSVETTQQIYNEEALIQLFYAVEEKYGQKVVVLVDGYDKPLLDPLLDSNCDIDFIKSSLKSFYSILSGFAEQTLFTLFTGKSVCSSSGLLSCYGSVDDVTFDPNYTTLFGITEGELKSVFEAEFDPAFLEELKKNYEGYRWGETYVFNPYDLMLALRDKECRNYSFEASPTISYDLLRRNGVVEIGKKRLVSERDLRLLLDDGNVNLTALFFQLGYLTVTHTHELAPDVCYDIDVPNDQMRCSLDRLLLASWCNGDSTLQGRCIELKQALMARHWLFVRFILINLLEDIAHNRVSYAYPSKGEFILTALRRLFVCAFGDEALVEYTSKSGRLNLVVRLLKEVFVFGFKLTDRYEPGAAIRETIDNRYYKDELNKGNSIHLIGFELSPTDPEAAVMQYCPIQGNNAPGRVVTVIPPKGEEANYNVNEFHDYDSEDGY